MLLSKKSFMLVLAIASTAIAAHEAPRSLLTFEGAIGADTLTAAGGVDVLNVVRGISPGGRTWVLRKLKVTVGVDGSIVAKGSGLLLASGESIGTRGAVAAVAATLFCGPANATARAFTTPPSALDTSGNFQIKARLSEDGINAAVMPPTCENPVLLVRAANATTGVAGPWFAAGIPGGGDDD